MVKSGTQTVCKKSKSGAKEGDEPAVTMTKKELAEFIKKVQKDAIAKIMKAGKK